MIEIVSSQGKVKNITIQNFSALDGWEFQRRFIEFASTTDPKIRRAYIMDVLSYAKVEFDDLVYPLSTDAMIDNHLEHWKNIVIVFEGILMQNGIDPKTHAESPSFWSNAGAELAVGFLAETTKLMGPAMEMMQQRKAE